MFVEAGVAGEITTRENVEPLHRKALTWNQTQDLLNVLLFSGLYYNICATI